MTGQCCSSSPYVRVARRSEAARCNRRGRLAPGPGKEDNGTFELHHTPHGLASWLLTKTIKRIALLYLASITFFFFLGGLFAFMIRVELLTPAGDRDDGRYATHTKIHHCRRVRSSFFLIPSFRRSLALPDPDHDRGKGSRVPRINLLIWYIRARGLFTLTAALSGGVDTGWTFYTPYSTAAANSHVVNAALGVFITGFSSILTGLNFIVDGPPDARSRLNVVPAAAVRVAHYARA